MIRKDFKDTHLFIYDGYLMVEARPDLDELMRKEAQKLTAAIRHQMTERMLT
jgi:hypothetical protein